MASRWAANGHELAVKVHDVPIQMENDFASLKLASMSIKIDSPTAEQKKYLESWETGT